VFCHYTNYIYLVTTAKLLLNEIKAKASDLKKQAEDTLKEIQDLTDADNAKGWGKAQEELANKNDCLSAKKCQLVPFKGSSRKYDDGGKFKAIDDESILSNNGCCLGQTPHLNTLVHMVKYINNQ